MWNLPTTFCAAIVKYMKFRTEVDISASEKKLQLDHSVFSIGSCFSAEISRLLERGQIQNLNNPFGTIFNPVSLKHCIKKCHDAGFYSEQELISFGGNYISLDHHTSFDSPYSHLVLEKINSKIELANQFLQHTDFVVVTYGTSFIYQFLPQKRLAANCHKIPAKFFEKRLLSHLELTDAVYETIQLLTDICKPNVQIIFSVSPVRHTRDGIQQNTLSKAKLFTAIHEVIPEFSNCTYLPIFEIVMDDLRDYRFYREDMVHPSEQAVKYIFEKFGEAFFSDQTKQFISENFKILSALEHRPLDSKCPQYLEFSEKIKQRISVQQNLVKHRIFQEFA